MNDRSLAELRPLRHERGYALADRELIAIEVTPR
jgi:hypothetical protein